MSSSAPPPARSSQLVTAASLGGPPPPMAAKAKLMLATDRGDCQKLKDAVNKQDATTMVVVMTSSSNNNKDDAVMDVPVAVGMHPLLLAAASNGDWKGVNFLLNRAEEQADPSLEPTEEFLKNLEAFTSGNSCIDLEGANDVPTLSAESLLQGVTVEGDTPLHVVATHGDDQDFLDCVDIIYGKAKHLLFEKNNDGNTPLHCAARAGKMKMVSCLIDLAVNYTDTIIAGTDHKALEFLRTENDCKETALHEAVRIGDNEIVKKLMAYDSELARFPEEGTSPLYLAIFLGKDDIVQTLYEMSKENILSYAGPNGQNVLHATAVLRGKGKYTAYAAMRNLRTIEKLLNWKKDLAKQADKNGSTPLHFAASLSCNPVPVLMHVLRANPAELYQADSQGLYPIHVAALSGAIGTVCCFIREEPKIAGLRDSKGRTFLHIAVEKGRRRMVAHACRTQSLAWILNMRDNEGNTAIHIAVQRGSLCSFSCLLKNRKVNLNIQNKKGQTPLDISERKIRRGFSYTWNPEILILGALTYCFARNGSRREDHIQEEYLTQQKQEDEDSESEKLIKSTQTLGIGSVLIVTVTFGATFALPGGYKSDGTAKTIGTPTLAGNPVFDAFIMAITLAFICSGLATINLMYSGVPMVDLHLRRGHFNVSSFLAMSSVTSLSVAFALGMLLVLAPVAWTTAAAICVMIAISSLCSFAGLFNGLPLAWALLSRMGIHLGLPNVAQIFFLYTLGIYWPCVIIFGWAAISTKHAHE